MRRLALAVGLIAAMTGACGHIQSGKTDVRVFNALYGYDTLDLFVGDRLRLEDLPFGVRSDYFGVSVTGNDDGAGGGNNTTTTASSSTVSVSSTTTLSPPLTDVTAALVTTSTTDSSSTTTTSTTTTTLASGTRTILVFVDALATRLIEQSVSLTADQKYTFYAYEGVGSGRLARLVVEKESKQKLIEGKLKIRVADMAPSSGVVDVYVLARGQTVAGRPPASVRLAPTNLTDYFDVDPGQYRIVFTQAGSKTVVFDSADAGLLDLAEDTVQTMIVFDKKGGGRPLQYLVAAD